MNSKCYFNCHEYFKILEDALTFTIAERTADVQKSKNSFGINLSKNVFFISLILFQFFRQRFVDFRFNGISFFSFSEGQTSTFHPALLENITLSTVFTFVFPPDICITSNVANHTFFPAANNVQITDPVTKRELIYTVLKVETGILLCLWQFLIFSSIAYCKLYNLFCSSGYAMYPPVLQMPVDDSWLETSVLHFTW